MEIKFNCIVTGNQKEKIAEFTEWLDGDGWKHDYYAPLVTNGVFDHQELGDGWFGKIIRRRFVDRYDKKGKEIYEGDIVRGKSGNSTALEVIHEGEKLIAYRPNYHIAVVVFYKSAFCLHNEPDTDKHNSESKYNGTSYYGTLQSASYDIEIIGNIFQHPELLHNK